MPQDHFGERVAARYDECTRDMFEPAAVDPVVDFLAELAGDGAALELGIGTGRIALPLAAPRCARARHRPLGGDGRETARKAGCRRHRRDDRRLRHDDVEGTFSLAYLVFNTIVNLTTQDEQVACFQNVAAHLEPGGCFVIEVGVPRLQRLAARRDHPSLRHRRDPPRASTSTTSSPRASSPTTTGGRTASFERSSVPFRYVWPSELDLMARLAGMTLRERWSDWKREPFTSESPKHVSVWEKKA